MKTDCRLRPAAAAISVAAAMIVLLKPVPAMAHVKWFSNFDYATPPRDVSEITSPVFWAMFALTLITLVGAVLADERINNMRAFRTLAGWLEGKSQHSLLVVRVAAFATLLVAWQQGTLLTPELQIEGVWLGRFQFVILLLLLFPDTTWVAGAAFMLLWGIGAALFGVFHMLDYVNALGIGLFLLIRPSSHPRLRDLGLPVLYATVGFSLLWLGCEKLVYPQWALYLLEQNPMLSLGLPPKFFLVAAAFVEMGLGFLLIICLFSRALSITITLVFFLTTCVFGKVEIIGHTLVHAALIVFLFEGAGHRFTPPALFHRTRLMRCLFATVNFSVVLFLALFAYTGVAKNVTAPMAHVHEQFAVSSENAPQLKMVAYPDSRSGWNVHLLTENFRFTPADAGQETVAGEGHVHLYLDGRKVARVYSPWYHLAVPQDEPHQLRATLNTNDHSDYAIDGEVIEATIDLNPPQ